MNKLTILAGAIPVLLLLIGAPLHAFALSDQQRYSDGFHNGFDAAVSDKQAGNSYNDACDPNGQYTSDGKHTDIYCSGWAAGYANYWNNADNVNSGQQVSQSADINVRGNGNHVTVNQGVSNGGSGRDGGTFKGDNPRCLIICASIK